MHENTIPWIIKIVPAVVGAILALVLSGDIDKDGKIRISLSVIVKFIASVTISVYGGAAFIEYQKLTVTLTTQGFIMLMFAVFGILLIGILYQSIALMNGKPLNEVLGEIKEAFLSIIGNGKK